MHLEHLNKGVQQEAKSVLPFDDSLALIFNYKQVPNFCALRKGYPPFAERDPDERRNETSHTQNYFTIFFTERINFY